MAVGAVAPGLRPPDWVSGGRAGRVGQAGTHTGACENCEFLTPGCGRVAGRSAPTKTAGRGRGPAGFQVSVPMASGRWGTEEALQ
jgi:hypothetical protein